MGEKAMRWNTAMEQANNWSTFHTSAPLVTATTLRETIVVFVLLAMLFAVDLSLRVRAVSSPALCDHAWYRLVDREQSGSLGLSILGFAVSVDACTSDFGRVAAAGASSDFGRGAPTAGASSDFGRVGAHEVRVAGQSALNGFALLVGAGQQLPAISSARFRIDGSDDNASWTECGPTAWEWQDRGASPFDAHAQDTYVRSFDLRPPWPWRLRASVPGLRAAMYVLIAFYGRTSKPERTQHVWLAMHCVLCVVFGAAAIGCQLSTASLSCLLWFLASVASLLVGTAVHFCNNKLLPVAMMYAATMMVVHSLDASADSALRLLFALLPDALSFLLGAVVTVARRMVTVNSVKKIMQDKRKYDQLWVQLHASELQTRNLAHLSEVVRQIQPAHPARQFMRREVKEEREPSTLFNATTSGGSSSSSPYSRADRSPTRVSLLPRSSRGISGLAGIDSPLRLVKRPWGRHGHARVPSSNELRMANVDTDAPISSLDQLFAQAAGLEPLCRCKVQDWALSSHGRSPVWLHGQLEFITWEDVLKEGLAADVKWPTLKSSQRAIQKSLRSYSGDVSQLLDLCRNQIVFKEVPEMTACLQTILADEDVTVLRVKNRLAESYDARQTAGYRDVALNLRMVTPQAHEIGVDTHVFELQLILIQFAQARSTSGHKRYVEFRNALAA